MINLNELAVKISEREGKVKEVNIAQIKEILSITLELLAEEENKNPGSVNSLLIRIKK